MHILWLLGILWICIDCLYLKFSVCIILGKTFVEHGGDSLTAMQFTATVKELFGVNLPVDMLLSSNLSLDQLRDLISDHTSVSSTGNDDTLDLMKADMKLELSHFGNHKFVDTNSVFLTGWCVLCVCVYVCIYCTCL